MLSPIKTSWLKFIIGWIVCFGIRLIPFRPPNVEPILTTTMPFAKKYKHIGGFVFGFLSIVLFDIVVSKVGMWTLITGVAYGLLGVGAYYFFRNREAKTLHFLIYSIIGTILYDAITGLSIGPLFFGQSLTEAFVMQIPFTVMHLGSNMVFAVTISPLIYKWIVTNQRLEINIFGKHLARES